MLRLPNQTVVVGGGPATVGQDGGALMTPSAPAHQAAIGRRRWGWYYPNPYSCMYPTYGYGGLRPLWSQHWFGGWPYNYPFGFGYAYPGWAAPFAVVPATHSHAIGP